MAAAAAPALGRVGNYNIGDMIDWQRDQIRKRDFTVLGRALNVRLGIDGRAQYFQSEAWRRVMPNSKVMGLTLEWPEDRAPWVGFANDRQTLLFINGIEHAPSIAATVLRNLEDELRDGAAMRQQNGAARRIPQNITDYASGKIISRDGWQFACCQPVEQIAVLAGVKSAAFNTTGTFLMLRGWPVDGRYPSLLTGFKHHKAFTETAAYLCHGMMQFTNSEKQQPKEKAAPWLNP